MTSPLNILFLCLVVSIACVTSVHAKIRIMPLGDDLTVGNGVPGGYRKKLFYSLREKGYDIDFVGSSTENSVAQLLDNDHEGHESWGCDKLKEFSQEIFDQVDDPDVILLSIGAQDMKGGDYMDAIQKWDDLILHISKIRPHAHIIASNLIHEKNHASDFNDRVDDSFNPFVPDIVQKHSDNGRKVSFVDIASVIGPTHFMNGIYLNTRGYKLLGKTFSTAVQNVILEDSYPPQIVRAEGSMDKTQVTLTFSKPLSDASADVGNFVINHGVEIIAATLDDEKRKITLTAAKQYPHEKTYTASVVGDVLDGGGLRVPMNSSIKFQPGFRFMVLSDWHSAEKYVKRDIYPETQQLIDQDVKIVKFLSRNYGGEFVLIPGDTNAGQWDRTNLRSTLSGLTGNNLTSQETVLEAGKRCYGGMLNSFRIGGYAKILLAHGDHEAGDNPWKAGATKSIVQPEFRKALGNSFNSDYDEQPRYNGTIGDARARPLGNFSDTAYAYLHKNILVVTVDPFYQEDPNKKISQAGTVAMRITGYQLDWLDQVLGEGRKLPQVKHIFVQAHVPVLHPVKKSRSSGQMMEDEEKSDFWKTLRKYNVDIYFTGEVHLNTVTKDKESNIIQIASRGNYFNNFLTVDVSDDEISIRCHNEVGKQKIRYNLEYETSGSLVINKSGNSTEISGLGQLAMIDPSAPLIQFDFEEKLSLESRSILGLGLVPGVAVYKPFLKSVPVNGIPCAEVLPNIGEFGSDYDAQSANVDLVDGLSGKKAGRFAKNSRAGIWAMGPHFEGREVSYSLWINTNATNMPILIAYEGYWIKPDIMNLRLRDGRPELAVSPTTKLKVKDSIRLNDGKWHHIVVSHTEDNSKLSKVKMYVDGNFVITKVKGKDSKVNFPNGGVVSLGGFGHGRSSNAAKRYDRTGYQNGHEYVGLMDEVKIFARGLSAEEVVSLYSDHASIAPPSSSPTASPSLASSSSGSAHLKNARPRIEEQGILQR